MVGSPEQESFSEWVAEVKNSYTIKKSYNKPFDTNPLTFTKTKNESETPEIFSMEQPKSIEKIPENVVVRDLNTITADDLQMVKGIGKVYSNRIIKFRDQLGGFSSVDQLLEVYGITPELKNKIANQFEIRSEVAPLILNTDSVKQLIKHPYISYDMAWVLINYRKQHGDIKGIEDLSNIKAINDSIIQKLRPYLK